MAYEKFTRRWFMCDLARQRVFVKEEFTLWLDALERLGYNGLGIYLEGAFAFKSIPGVIRDGVLTYDDAAWIVSEGEKRGIFVFPMTNVVGHMEHFFGQERNRALLARDTVNQLDFFNEQAEAYIMNIVHEYADAFGTKFVHIGGDETHLTPETKLPYAKFLAKIASNLLAEGIKPAIWDDMIWMDKPLCEVFDRETFIFDWSYYGHRPDSPAYFRDLGFRDIVVCPCDNSWEGFINYQRISGYLGASRDIPVRPDEIEAFFDDAKKAGVMGGLLTNWNNETGRNMWAQWVPIARSGLFMSGEFPAGGRDDEKIEKALFGRVTPYTESTYILQDKIQNPKIPFTWFQTMRNALFSQKPLSELIQMSMEQKPVFPEEYDSILAEIEDRLAAWTPASPFEERCFTAMYGVVATIRAANAIVKAARAYSALYVRAAELQFTAPAAARQLLSRFSDGFKRAANEVSALGECFNAAISGTGHTQNDIMRIGETEHMLWSVAFGIDEFAVTLDRIPLPRFERIVARAITGAYILN